MTKRLQIDEKSKIDSIINKLRKGRLSVLDVPEEFASNKEILQAERTLGLRKSGHRGFDIIKQEFFVEEGLFNRAAKLKGNRKKVFDTFEKYYDYLDGDIYEDACYYQYLFDDDFSKTLNLDLDRLQERKCFISETIDDYSDDVFREKNNNLVKNKYVLKKAYEEGSFKVEQIWIDEKGDVVKQSPHIFTYFFDFLAFLKGDLSDADLIFCNGMENISDITEINLSNAKLTSRICEKIGIPYDIYEFGDQLIDEFPMVEDNECQTKLVLESSREDMLSIGNKMEKSEKRIFYISDLHLIHRIKKAKCRSKEDIIYFLQNIANVIAKESGEIVLIGGDVSSNFSIFEWFVELLEKAIRKSYKRTKFVFVLGNHELWNFSGSTLDEIEERYRSVLEKNRMYFLNNEILCVDDYGFMEVIPYHELAESNIEQLSERLKYSKLVILGGVGFSGYNQEFNANAGVYKDTIDRKMEIQESKKFENLYNKMMCLFEKKNTIIFTHMPKEDWCIDGEHHDGFVYVSGHNHRNEFYDDGIKRIYSDNQIGYRNESMHLKNFLIDYGYDLFIDYEDGIYEITSQEYQDFMRGKNIRMTFNRTINILYMLKRKGYYCFILKSNSGTLAILNGGAPKKLIQQDIEYYYNQMDAIVQKIKAPLDEYTIYQKRISNEIKEIGGRGSIHGCIIDIDFWNHVYVNPIDRTITGYFAYDMTYKILYPSIPALLKDRCQILYGNYQRMIEEKKENVLMIKQESKESEELEKKQGLYLERDIYKMSREVKKMQKLNDGILTVWLDVVPDNLELMQGRDDDGL